MNYKRIYDTIVSRAKVRQLTDYKEQHHIIPKCLGGSDDKDNLVDLTAREHFLCHWLLIRIYPEESKLAYAFWNMCNGRKNKYQLRYIPTSRTYQEAKIHAAKSQSLRKVSDKTKQKLSEAKKGKLSPTKGKSWTHNQSLICGANSFKPGHIPWTKGKTLTKDHINKRTESRKDYKVSEETKQKISAGNKGKLKPWTEEQRQKQSLSKKGVEKPKKQCSTCGRLIGGLGNLKKHEKSCKVGI